MTKFENKATDIKLSEFEGEEKKSERGMTFADLTILCLNLPPQGGYSVSEMKTRLPITEKLDTIKLDANGSVELEQAQLEKIQECENKMDGHWTQPHKDLIAFSAYIRKLGEGKSETEA